MFSELERIFDFIVSRKAFILTVDVHRDCEVVAGEEAPNSKNELKDSHNPARLLESVKSIARPVKKMDEVVSFAL